jgi:hypothetical protein
MCRFSDAGGDDVPAALNRRPKISNERNRGGGYAKGGARSIANSATHGICGWNNFSPKSAELLAPGHHVCAWVKT